MLKGHLKHISSGLCLMVACILTVLELSKYLKNALCHFHFSAGGPVNKLFFV
jgi:hypothetical protein